MGGVPRNCPPADGVPSASGSSGTRRPSRLGPLMVRLPGLQPRRDRFEPGRLHVKTIRSVLVKAWAALPVYSAGYLACYAADHHWSVRHMVGGLAEYVVGLFVFWLVDGMWTVAVNRQP